MYVVTDNAGSYLGKDSETGKWIISIRSEESEFVTEQEAIDALKEMRKVWDCPNFCVVIVPNPLHLAYQPSQVLFYQPENRNFTKFQCYLLKKDLETLEQTLSIIEFWAPSPEIGINELKKWNRKGVEYYGYSYHYTNASYIHYLLQENIE